MLKQHSRLFPWYVGIAIIVAFEAIVAYMFFNSASPCSSSTPPIFLALLVVLPVIYLALMFLALKSQP